jgi:hypothetical protein
MNWIEAASDTVFVLGPVMLITAEDIRVRSQWRERIAAEGAVHDGDAYDKAA